jgi:hypothetical protein
MLEYWNTGVMGFGEMGMWAIDKISHDGQQNKSINNKIP